MVKKVLRCLSCIFITMIFCVGCIMVDIYLSDASQYNKASDNNTSDNNTLNSISGNKASNTVLYEDDMLICYEDRILKKFVYEDNYLDNTISVVNGMLCDCGKLEKVFIMPIPGGVIFEQEGEDFDKIENTVVKYEEYMDKLNNKIKLAGCETEKITLMDVSKELKKHKNEYIFFKTEDSWTARGAYYGMNSLCEALSLDSIPLNQYEEHVYNSFTGGVMAAYKKNELSSVLLPEDKLIYYILPNSKNRVCVMTMDENGKKTTYKKPLITASSRNTSSIISGRFCRAIVEGDALSDDLANDKKGHYVLLVCDDAGKLLAMYLKDYYDGVYVININEDYAFSMEINEIVEANNISEVVFAQNAIYMGNPGYSRAFNKWQQGGVNN